MSNQLQTVSFAGTDLFIVNQAGKPFVPMRTIVEGMGMDWKSQHEKLKTRFNTCVVEITTQLPNDTQTRAVTCLPLAKIAGWLYSVSPNKVAPEIREKVIQYQNECDTALFDYWTKGVAVKPADTITAEQRHTLHEGVLRKAERDRQHYRATWRSLYNHIGRDEYKTYTLTEYEQSLEWLGIANAAPKAVPQLEGIGQELKGAYWAMLAELDALSPQKGFYSEHCNQVDSAKLKDCTDLIPAMHTAIAAFKRTITPVTPLPVEPSHREVSIEAWKVIDLNRDLHKVMQAIDGIAARVGGIGMLKSDLPDSWWHSKRLAA